jgi:hypothetical protein
MAIGTPWTRRTVSTWIRAILLGPGGRARRLRLIATPILYLKEPQYYYTGTLHPALVGFGLVTYVLILAAAAQSSAGKPKTWFHAVRSPVRLVSAAVTVFFGVTCVVVSTNTDMQTLTGSYFMIGATSIATICAPPFGRGFQRQMNACCAEIGLFFDRWRDVLPSSCATFVFRAHPVRFRAPG